MKPLKNKQPPNLKSVQDFVAIILKLQQNEYVVLEPRQWGWEGYTVTYEFGEKCIYSVILSKNGKAFFEVLNYRTDTKASVVYNKWYKFLGKTPEKEGEE